MNEEQIAQRLQQNIPRDDPVTAAPPSDPVTKEVVENGVGFAPSIETYRLLDHFEVPMEQRSNQNILEKIQYVLLTAQSNTGGDVLDSLNYIRMLESQLNLRLKGNRLHHLYEFLRLDQEARAIEARKLEHVG